MEGMNMERLNSPLKEQVESIMNESNQEFDKRNYHDSIRLLENAWGLLPEPKGEYSESYHIALYASETYLLIKDNTKAKEWADIIYKCGLNRVDSGEREFLSAKVAFESGDLEKAKGLFAIANNKSEGRCFGSDDAKYLKFFKKK